MTWTEHPTTPSWRAVAVFGGRPDARGRLEAAIGVALGHNPRLRDQRIVATAGPDGLVTLTGTVATHALRSEVELSCWTVPGVLSLHDDLVVGH